jgi:hypothetical protein
MDLDHHVVAGYGKVMGLSRGRDEPPGTEGLGLGLVDRVSHAHQKVATDDRDMLIGGVEVGGKDISSGKFEANRIHGRGTGIALIDGELSALREK